MMAESDHNETADRPAVQHPRKKRPRKLSAKPKAIKTRGKSGIKRDVLGRSVDQKKGATSAFVVVGANALPPPSLWDRRHAVA